MQARYYDPIASRFLSTDPIGYQDQLTALKAHAQPAPRRLPAPLPMEDVVVPISLNVSLMALNDSMCKWPIGDPTDESFHFCGHKNFNGLPYCEYHSRLAYQPPSDRRRDRASK